ncbi:MAG TPA: alcohol dehydrogenase catalytic domain-containing protein [Thermoanaerobaculia bacterium]|nr:alcohol dehydrogenase catalytic domain-containing protein [Thermoanaerobaculia bacterium]
MRALWLEDRRLRLRDDVPLPSVAGEARIRVLMAGVCNTDIELTRGYYPFAGIPGHEFVGMVEEGPDALRGKRVVGEINAVCGRCEACVHGRATHCENRNVLGIIGRNGAFAEFLTLPARNLHVVPDDLSNEVAVFTEPLAAALEIQEQIEIGPSDRVLVVGDGKLGQLVARTLALTGCTLAVSGRHRAKLALLERAGIRTIAADAIAPRSFDIAVECSGSASGFALARTSLRPRGTLVMKSTYAGELTLNASSIVVDELTIIGSRCGPFPAALRLLADRAIDPTPLIHARYPLSDGIAAFEHAQKPGVLKVLLDCER